MGFIIGSVKFTTGVVIGAAVGAAVATFIVTRDTGETVAQLRALVNDMLTSGREAYQAEEARMNSRYKQLVEEAGQDRQAQKQLKSAEKKSEGK